MVNPCAARPNVGLLDAGDPPPVYHDNREGRAPVLLICDHASKSIPARLNGLGVSESVLDQHVGWDIGAAELTRVLSRLLDAQAVLSGYSRLVIDCNRPLDNPASIPRVSDGHVIPGNQDVDSSAARARAEACFWPYHRMIERVIDDYLYHGVVPAIVSIHSFTPHFEGVSRQWHVGVLWDRDSRLPHPIMARLAGIPDIVVGDNEPYSALNPTAYSIPVHALARGLPHVLLEIRQDLIDSVSGVMTWADRLARALEAPLNDPGIYRVSKVEP